jgi:hypothetical protein
LNQQHLEVVIELLIEGSAIEEARDLGKDGTTRLGETLFELKVWLASPAEKATENHRNSSRGASNALGARGQPVTPF